MKAEMYDHLIKILGSLFIFTILRLINYLRLTNHLLYLYFSDLIPIKVAATTYPCPKGFFS